MSRHHNQYLAAIIGHAVGDAMGFPTEFSKREELLKNPVIEMIDSSDVGQPAGSWSDDTAMEIATIDSFIQKKCFDYKDIMDKWVKWISKSEYTPTGVAYDIRRTCLKAIKKYCNGTPPLQCGSTSMNENGNGSLMRILPVALYAYSKNLDDISIRKLTNEVSSLTHAHEISRLGCYIYVQFIICLLKGKTKEEAKELATIFSEMVTGETDERQEELGDAQFLAGVSKFPARVKCSTLAWNALKKAIDVGEAQETVIHGE